MQDPSTQTITFRNVIGQTALPMRQLGSFQPGTGVGGAMVHWNGQNRANARIPVPRALEN